MKYPKITTASIIVVLLLITALFFFLVSDSGSSSRSEEDIYYSKIIAGLKNKTITYIPIDARGEDSFKFILQEEKEKTLYLA